MKRIEIVMIDRVSPDEAVVEKAAEMLRRGLLVVGPTETQYGLMARGDENKVLEQLYNLKKRELNKPTAIFVGSYWDVSKYAYTNQMSDKAADAFLPGPLTLVLAAREQLKPPVACEGKVGLRVSSSAFLISLLKKADYPITATSANLSGATSADSAQEAADCFGDAVSMYLDGGVLDGPASTVIDCSGAEVKLLREGAISFDLVRETISGVQ